MLFCAYQSSYEESKKKKDAGAHTLDLDPDTTMDFEDPRKIHMHMLLSIDLLGVSGPALYSFSTN
jgi:hypothetical protein